MGLKVASTAGSYPLRWAGWSQPSLILHLLKHGYRVKKTHWHHCGITWGKGGNVPYPEEIPVVASVASRCIDHYVGTAALLRAANLRSRQFTYNSPFC